MHKKDLREVLHLIQDDKRLREETYRLTTDQEDVVSYQALWACTHFSEEDAQWLSLKQDELIDAVLTCTHSGKRRMYLHVLCEQPVANPPRIDFLDFCLQHMIAREEPPAVQALCIKLAYRMTCSIPELKQELRAVLEIMEPELLTPATRATRRNILKAMRH